MSIPERPKSLCMAPWVHTYLSPQTERRMCCASREPAQNFKQYIDTEAGTGRYIPITLEEHWNGEHMRDVRKRMLAGETLPECTVCNEQLLNVDVYRDYFWHMFKHLYKDIYNHTDENGYTSMQPVSWDYRFSNLCNFKCRTCGDMLSSSWESEQKIHNMVNWQDPKNNWMQPDVRSAISQFQDTVIEQEFSNAVENHSIEEIYWVGGEPLMYEQHWRYMKRIIELGDGPKVYARYNTNLSRIVHGDTHLFRDILSQCRDWQICASLDGVGVSGEYIRTGLNYKKWLANFEEGLKYSTNRRQMRIDFTLTLPGLDQIIDVEHLADELGVEMLAKVIFSFSPDIIMSPLALPRHILDPIIGILIDNSNNRVVIDLLNELRSRPTFQEQYSEADYREGLRKGKARVLELERIRTADITMEQILYRWPSAFQWWSEID